ncbi:MAG: hypothetical protein GX347_07740 [Epulopiscium sp.]|nr:hypothetical protein [Candidatus Epulonipiscium sp.]
MRDKIKKMWLLTKVLLKGGMGKSKMKPKWKVLVGFLVCLWLIPVAGSIVAMVAGLYDGLASLGQEGLLLEIGMGSASFLVLFFGILYLLNLFYFDKDIENLLSLPFTPGQIIGAKFIVALVYEYVSVSFILLPVLGVFGIKARMGIWYYLYSILVFMTMPAIPLVMAGIIVMIVMRFTNIGKNKDILKIVGGIIGIIFAIGLNIGIQRFTGNMMDPSNLQQLIHQGNNSLLGKTMILFPQVKMSNLGLLYSSSFTGLLWILGFLAVAFLAYFIFLLLGEMIYFKGVVGLSESKAKRKIFTSEALQRQSIQRSVFYSCFWKEIRILLRTPVYFLNCIVMNILGPFFLLIPFFTAQEEGIFEESVKLAQNPNRMGMLLGIGFGIILFFAGTTGIASTALSREGQQIFVNKMLPIDYMTQIIAKVASAAFIGFWGVLILAGIGIILFRFSFIFIILFMFLGSIGLLFSAFLGILIDLYHPKLDWDNEQKAVKQNFNVFLHMLMIMVFAGITIFLSIIIRPSILYLILGIGLVYGCLTLLLWFWVKQISRKAFEKIEV